MLNDFTMLYEGAFGEIGSRRMNVAANASGNGSGTSYVPAFRPGEFAGVALGGATVLPLYSTSASGNSKPVVATDFIFGLVVGPKTSTETAAAAGYVDVMPLTPGQVFLGNPAVAATWDTQSEYDALVGDRVLIDLASGNYSAGSYSLLATDGATYGAVIQPLDISKFPGKIAFALRNGVSNLT